MPSWAHFKTTDTSAATVCTQDATEPLVSYDTEGHVVERLARELSVAVLTVESIVVRIVVVDYVGEIRDERVRRGQRHPDH